MRAQYEITFEEFREALSCHAGAPVVTRKKSAWVLLFIAVACAGYWAGEKYLSAAPGSALPPDPLIHAVLLPLFAWGLILGSTVFLVAQTQVTFGGKPWKSRRAPTSLEVAKRVNVARRRLVVCLSVCIFSILFFAVHIYTLDFDTGRIQPTGSTSDGWMVPIIFYSFYLCWANLVQIVTHRNAARLGWAKQEHLRQEMVLDADAAGIVLATSFSRSELRWEYFPGCLEGPNVFLLYSSASTFQIVPKRAFASDAEVDEFRSLLQNHIVTRSRGFPVVPAAEPVPALPVGQAGEH